MTSPWTAPGAGAEPALSPGRPPAPATPTVPDPAPLPPVPVAFGPMTVADVLDGAFEILKRRPRELAIIAAATILPVQVLVSVLFRDLFGSDVFSLDVDAFEESGSTGPSSGSSILLYTLSAASLALTCAAVSVIVADWYRGIRRPIGGVLAHTVRRGPALLLGVVIVKVLEFVGLFGVGIGALVAMALLHVVSPVIALETGNPFVAVGRSVRLTSTQWWRSAVVPMLVGLVGMLVSGALAAIALLAVLAAPDEWSWLMVGTGQLLTNLLLVPFTAGVATLYHLDLRIRSEGLDIEERARAVFDR